MRTSQPEARKGIAILDWCHWFMSFVTYFSSFLPIPRLLLLLLPLPTFATFRARQAPKQAPKEFEFVRMANARASGSLFSRSFAGSQPLSVWGSAYPLLLCFTSSSLLFTQVNRSRSEERNPRASEDKWITKEDGGAESNQAQESPALPWHSQSLFESICLVLGLS